MFFNNYTWTFPKKIYDTRIGHFMYIKAYPVKINKAFNSRTDAFILPMPLSKDSYAYKHRHTYADVKLMRAAAGMVGYEGVYDAINTIGGLAGAPLNPSIEVVYENTSLRDFKFSFLFAPESEDESREVANICKYMRYHSSPQRLPGITVGLNTTTGGGLFMGSPSKFSIDYVTYENGTWKRNNDRLVNKLPRIYEGFVDAIEVDYAPGEMYSTFSNGYPVAVQLSISFRETAIIDKNMIEEEGY